MSDLKSSLNNVKNKSFNKNPEKSSINAYRTDTKKTTPKMKINLPSISVEIFIIPFKLIADLLIVLFTFLYKIKFILFFAVLLIFGFYMIGFDILGATYRILIEFKNGISK